MSEIQPTHRYLKRLRRLMLAFRPRSGSFPSLRLVQLPCSRYFALQSKSQGPRSRRWTRPTGVGDCASWFVLSSPISFEHGTDSLPETGFTCQANEFSLHMVRSSLLLIRPLRAHTALLYSSSPPPSSSTPPSSPTPSPSTPTSTPSPTPVPPPNFSALPTSPTSGPT